MLKRVSDLVPFIIFFTIITVQFIVPRSFSFTAPVPDTYPYSHETYAGTVTMKQERGEMISYKYSQDFSYVSSLIAIILVLIAIPFYIYEHKKKKVELSTKQHKAAEIKNHPLYETFVDENEEHIHIYKEDLPAAFGNWLIEFTNKPDTSRSEP